MSILSDAWRRAHDADARLAKTLGAPAVTLRQRPPLLPWLICGLLVALVVGLGVYIWLDQSRPTPTPVPVASVVASNAGRTAEGTSRHVVAVPPVTAEVAHPSTRSAEHRSEAAGAQAGVATSSAGAIAAGERPRQVSAVREAAAGSEAASPSPSPPAVRRAAAAPSPPRPIALAAAPEAVRTAFPSLDIGVHVWNADPASRFIMIGVQKFHAGDEIAPGVHLLKVTRNGEIVDFRGYRLILP